MPILLDGYEGQYDWITHTFRYGGVRLTMDTVEDCFNAPAAPSARLPPPPPKKKKPWTTTTKTKLRTKPRR